MSVRAFLDTNVLLYAEDASSAAKQRKAIALYSEHRSSRTGVVSIQVLQEYFAGATRKLRLNPIAARRKVELLSELDLFTPEVADVLAAIDLHRLHNFSFWDALIVRAAKQAGCKELLTEDLQHGREIEGIRIIDPFR